MNRILYFLLFLITSVTSLAGAEGVQDFGWKQDPQAVKRVVAQTVGYKKQLQDLVRFNDEHDALNYRFLYQALEESGQLSNKEKQSGRLSALNQGRVGSCVGYSTTQALDVLSAVNVYHRPNLGQMWNVRFNPDATYGIGRQKNLGSWDGSTGAWSIEGISTLGTLHRLKYDKFDLTNTEPPQGRVWARDGMPADLLVFATDHKVTASAQVNTAEEAKAALQNGYTIIVCAQASYESKRDQQGFSRRTGDAWAHAMAVVAYRGSASGKEGFLIWNSWGDDWNSGGVYPDDQPEGSFWVTPEDLKFHLNQGDSWAIAGYDGFKQRNITWEEVFLIGEPIK